MGLGKFWPDLEILEGFLMGRDFSFSGDFGVLESLFFCFCQAVSESRICGQIMVIDSPGYPQFLVSQSFRRCQIRRQQMEKSHFPLPHVH